MEDIKIKDGVVIPAWELWFTAHRASGPGGQHVNKTSTAVMLHWVPASTGAVGPELKEQMIARLGAKLTKSGELQVCASDERSQARNLELAQARLAEIVRASLTRPKRRRKTKPTRASKRRRLDAKKRRGDVKRQRQKPDSRDY